MRGDTKIKTPESNGIPKTSNVARSNSLRSSSPPRYRRPQFNVPPSLPEGKVLVMPPSSHPQYPPQYHANGPRRIEHPNQLVSSVNTLSCTIGTFSNICVLFGHSADEAAV